MSELAPVFDLEERRQRAHECRTANQIEADRDTERAEGLRRGRSPDRLRNLALNRLAVCAVSYARYGGVGRLPREVAEALLYEALLDVADIDNAVQILNGCRHLERQAAASSQSDEAVARLEKFANELTNAIAACLAYRMARSARAPKVVKMGRTRPARPGLVKCAARAWGNGT